MKYLLDTCALSELKKTKPNKAFIDWLVEQDSSEFCLSVLTIGEIEKGIGRLPVSKKRTEISHWLKEELTKRFEGRLLPVDNTIALLWGRISAHAEQSGAKLPVIDGLLMATALVHELVLVTRDIPAPSPGIEGLRILNPWI
jgi:predicted nucleic acid-binding protein